VTEPHSTTHSNWRTAGTPVLALLLLAAIWGRSLPALVVALVGVVLVAAVLVAVHHAEVVALRVGEPLGSLVLAVAVTVIEVGLILSLMLSGGTGATSLARDTVFAAVMITGNGIIGLCLVVGALRHGVVRFNAEGSSGSMATVAALATLCLVFPTVTTTSPGPTFSGPQLAFAAVVSLVLYGVYVFVQTVRHRDYFLTPASDEAEAHTPPPTGRTAALSAALLLVALVAIVGLAKALTPAVERGIAYVDVPKAVVGIIIAALVLLPEGLARCARPGATGCRPA